MAESRWRKRGELDPQQEVLVGADGRDLGTVWPACGAWSWSYRGSSVADRVDGLAPSRREAKAAVRALVTRATMERRGKTDG